MEYIFMSSGFVTPKVGGEGQWQPTIEAQQLIFIQFRS